MRRHGIALYVCSIGFLLCFGASAQDAPPKIAFLSDRDDNQEIYLMNADGSGQMNLTNFPGDDAEPSWSPDGTSIVFSRNVSGDTWNVFAQAVDTAEAQQLSDGGLDGAPQWSPNGAQIVFEAVPSFDPHISIVNVDGSGGVAMIDIEGDSGNRSSRPNWSPDGSQVVFAGSRGSGSGLDIYVMNADGTGEQALASTPENETRPSWSPDGQWIAFMSRKDSSDDYEIFVMSADGSNRLQLTDNDAYDGDLAWSPDSKQLAFNSVRDGHPQAYAIGIDGANERNLTQASGFDAFPIWSPDGSQIAFVSDRDGNQEIYVMNADGSGQTNLTNNPGNDFNPIWQPVAAGGAASQPAEAETAASDTDAAAPVDSDATSVLAQAPAEAPLALQSSITAANAGELVPVITIGSADSPISNSSIAFSPNSQYLAYINSSYSQNYAIGVWDLFAGQDTGLALTGSSGTQWLAITPDYALVALAQATTAMYRWSVLSGERLPYHSLPGIAVDSLTAISPDGTLMAGFANDGSLVIDETATGQTKISLAAEDAFRSPAFSTDNSMVALADANGPIQLWDLTAGTVLHTLPSNGGYDLAFTPDGQTVALCGANNGIEMWNTSTGQTLRGLPDAACTSMVFSPDGTLLATSNFLDVTIWDVASAQRVGRYPGRIVAFSPNGHFLATVTNDQSQLSIWGAPDTGVSPAPTATEAAAEVATAAPAETAAACTLTAINGANLRGGPGTNFDRAGTIGAGEVAEADGQSQAADGFVWYRLTTGAWVRGDLVTATAECSGLAEVS